MFLLFCVCGGFSKVLVVKDEDTTGCTAVGLYTLLVGICFCSSS